MKKYNYKMNLAVVLIISISIYSSGGRANSEKKILKVVPHVNLTILDPLWTSQYITRNHGYLIYDTLFSLDISGNPQPQMIKDYSVSDDGLSWKFQLRDGLKWHDGKDVSSDDCIASLKRWSIRDGFGQQLFKNIKEIKKTDERSFSIELIRPYKDILYTFSKVSSYVPFMMPKRVAETDPSKQITDYTGSGPFIFQKDQFQPGKKSVYFKNYNYVARPEPSSYAAGSKQAQVDEIDWVTYTNSLEAINALKNGEVDYLEAPDPKLINQIKDNNDIVISSTTPDGFVGVMRFNTLAPPFNNIAVRHAVASIIKPSNYMIGAFENEKNWTICTATYPCKPNTDSETNEILIDSKIINEAKRVIKESGYNNEPVVLLNAIDIPVVSSFSETTARNLRLLGMSVVVKNTTWAEMAQERTLRMTNNKTSWDIFHTFWASSDMENPNNILFSTDRTNGWFGWPNNAAIEVLRELYPFAKNEQNRSEIIDKIRQYTKYETNYIPLGQFVLPVAYRSRVHGVTNAPAQFYWTVYLDDKKPSQTLPQLKAH